MFNPFSKKDKRNTSADVNASSNDPLSVEDLLVDGSKKATITSEWFISFKYKFFVYFYNIRSGF